MLTRPPSPLRHVAPLPPPPPRQAYVAQQSDLCAEIRVQACLRLRDQASRLQTLLLDAPAVGIADAALRLTKAAAQDSSALNGQYSREARCGHGTARGLGGCG